MYKAMGEAAYNDGLFSQAAPFQNYQASVKQLGDGSLGAIAIPRPTRHAAPSLFQNLVRHHGASRRPVLPPPGHGASANSAYQSGYNYGPGYRQMNGLGRTFLPAFSPREMQGLGYVVKDGSLGHAYHDGVLGDDVTVSLPTVTTSAPKPAWKPDLASIGVGVIAGGLLFYFAKL